MTTLSTAAPTSQPTEPLAPPPERFADVPPRERESTDIGPKPARSGHAHVPVLDGIRGLAILLVLFFHFQLVEGSSPTVRLIQKTWGFGWAGVDLFFVLSGFLITGILLDAKNRPHYFRNFYARRTVRIFPLYYAFLVMMLLLLPAILGQAWMVAHLGKPPVGQWAYWCYVYNLFQGTHDPATFSHSLGVTWSLCIEEQFYLLWPTVVLLCSPRGLLKACCVLIGMSLLSRLLLVLLGYGEVPVSQWSFCRMDALAVGAALAVVFKTGAAGLEPLKRAARVLVWIVPVVVLSVNLKWGSLMRNPAFLVAGYTALAAMFGSLLLLTVTTSPGSALTRVFSNSFMRMLGRYSYAIYLFNQPVKFLLRDFVFDPNVDLTLSGSRVPAQFLFFLFAGGVTVALAWGSWHLFEKHFLKLKELFPMSPEKKAIDPPDRALPNESREDSLVGLSPAASVVAPR
jgi:peptidoglycan/LPS O-acetylase OafA/YrhL